MKPIQNNNNASAWPVMVVIIVIGLASFLVLTLSYMLEPGFNLMGANDSEVNGSVTAPRTAARGFFLIIWPYGVLISILFGVIIAMLMYYQKRRYQTQ